jgi:hypothetical protein
MKGLILSYWLFLAVLPATNMNCSKAEKPDAQIQTYNTTIKPDTTVSKNVIQNNPFESVVFKNQKGTIHIYVCTRGCYQYVLETALEGKQYKLSPNVLDDAFKKDNLTVIFSGKTTDELVDIKKPAPNDVPILDFKAPKVLMESIRLEL